MNITFNIGELAQEVLKYLTCIDRCELAKTSTQYHTLLTCSICGCSPCRNVAYVAKRQKQLNGRLYYESLSLYEHVVADWNNDHPDAITCTEKIVDTDKIIAAFYIMHKRCTIDRIMQRVIEKLETVPAELKYYTGNLQYGQFDRLIRSDYTPGQSDPNQPLLEYSKLNEMIDWD